MSKVVHVKEANIARVADRRADVVSDDHLDDDEFGVE
jgi:hypothetical protein